MKKVFVGMSGGVDSSVAAALLVARGYAVTGVFIKVWQPDWITCTWKEDRLDAMRVCALLNIPFITLDLTQEYKKEVVDYMIAEYQKGRTPNPDVMCNKYVKFGGFFDFALSQGADCVATGHYAQTTQDSKGEVHLVQSEDAMKDQSYFLWTLTQVQLAKTLFPVGNLEKKEVRSLAKKMNLPTSEKKDSQGLCFIGKIDLKDFLSHFITQHEGVVKDEEGKILGTHPGALFFTHGERHGFTITKKTPTDLPYYVVGKNIKNNEIIVSQTIDSSTSKEISLEACNWTYEMPSKENSFYKARGRYRQELFDVSIVSIQGDTAKILPQNPQNFLTPGQSLVLYNNNICIGGGIIS